MKTYVVIPTKLFPPYLDQLLGTLELDRSIEKIYLVVNDATPRILLRNHTTCGDNVPEIERINGVGLSIYEMWNKVWDHIKLNNPFTPFNIAFLNDDIELKPNTIMLLAHNLRGSYYKDLAVLSPDINASWNKPEYWFNGMANPFIDIEYTEITAGAGGMTGYCFIVKGEIDFKFDENLRLYWGDDDLVKQMILKGYKVGKLLELPIKHHTSTTISQMNPAERVNIMEKDRAYFNQKYGEQRGPVW